jgi:TonB-dependent SusC/RagA subfamily outer membrane receptor
MMLSSALDARAQSATDSAGPARGAGDSVPATGGRLPRLQVGASIGTIRADSIVPTAPILQFTDLLTARLPGVDVESGGGMSGSGARIIIRGGGSLIAGSDPVMYLDGVRIAADPPTFMTGAAATSIGLVSSGPLASGRLEDLNPNEIERIDVLTGPAATTQYGIDAWNGVVLVTTRRPASATAHWSAFAEDGVLTPPPTREADSYFGWGQTTASPSSATDCQLLEQINGTCVLDSITHFSPLSTGATSPLTNGYRDHLGLQVGGSVGPGRYFLSGDRQNETGILKMPASDVQLFTTEDGAAPLPGQLRPNSLDRTNLRATLGVDFGTHADLTLFGNGIGGNHRTADDQGLAEAVALGSGSSAVNDGWLGGPLRPRSLFANEATDRLYRSILGGAVTWRIATGITAHASGGTDHSDAHSVELIHAIDAQTELLPDGLESDDHRVTDEHSADADVSADLPIGRRWSMRTTIGAQLRSERDVELLSNTIGPRIITSNSNQSTAANQRGAYIEETVSDADRLSLTAAFRAEGPFGLFGSSTEGLPRFAASWTAVTHGDDALRVHAAYGRTSDLPASPGFGLPLNTTGSGLFTPASGARIDPDFITEYEAGMDATLFDQRLSVAGNFYDRTIDHMAFFLSNALGTSIISSGVVRNRGVELSVAASAVRTPMVTWDASLNAWTNANCVITLYPNASPIVSNTLLNGSFRATPGYPLYSLWEPNITYHDQNGDGIIEPNEVTGSAPVEQGSSLPTRGAALQNTIGIVGGRFRIGVLADYKGGNRMIDPVLALQLLEGTSRGSVDPHAPLIEQAQTVAMRQDSYFGPAQDASFVRLRELSLTVTATSRIARALRTTSAAISLLARNLWLWTPYKGTDPEINTNGNTDPITGQTVVPQPRYFVIRVTLGY